MDKGGSIRETRLCSVVSKGAGEDPAGSGGAFDSLLAVEGMLPWKRAVIESACFPERLRGTIEGLQNAGVADKFVGLVPDPEYSREGYSRVLYWRRPRPGPFAAYENLEYLVPDGEIVSFSGALREPDGLSRFEAYRDGATGVRDVLVCTHGARDVCCGKFGYPIYNILRSKHAAPGSMRVWRTSHLGGHRFAPTVLELPEGRYWGHLEIGAVEDLMKRSDPFSDLARF